MSMIRLVYLLLILAAAMAVSSCGGKITKAVTVHDRAAAYRSVYIWEPDGHTDFGLLMDLKEGVAKRLRSGGYSISNDPDATAAYLKVTLYDADKVNGSDGHIKGRIFIIEAEGRKVVYDVTTEVSGGVEAGYPVDIFLDEAMGPLLGTDEE